MLCYVMLCYVVLSYVKCSVLLFFVMIYYVMANATIIVAFFKGICLMRAVVPDAALSMVSHCPKTST